ncbi:hypothetical protein, partial [Pseudoalteromonas luteoviolacea]|uniref:hypothetical protein n=1 Tax=Pseudoalteromonas luteoviolacea TaxID=43657 RepID=UPI000A802475
FMRNGIIFIDARRMYERAQINRLSRRVTAPRGVGIVCGFKNMWSQCGHFEVDTKKPVKEVL